jgi:hypothetical protein
MLGQRHRLIDRTDQRVIDRGLRADVRQKGLARTQRGWLQLDHHHRAADRLLLREPGEGGRTFGENFVEAVVAQGGAGAEAEIVHEINQRSGGGGGRSP